VPVQLTKNTLQPVNQFVVVVMIASNHFACRQNKAVCVG
jgi:hypothetical protein